MAENSPGSLPFRAPGKGNNKFMAALMTVLSPEKSLFGGSVVPRDFHLVVSS
jgi:hypothetical protein